MNRKLQEIFIRSFAVIGEKVRSRIDSAVVRYICRYLLPFSTVEKYGCIEFITTLTKSRYEIGKRKLYKDKLHKMYVKAIAKAKVEF
jgi:hypothetical protein